MNLSSLLVILRARHKWVWGSTLVLALLAIAICMYLPDTYTAETQLLVDVKEPDLLLGQGAGAGAFTILAPNYMATQVDILHSTRVVKKVIHVLGLDSNEQAITQWRDHDTTHGTLDEYYGDILAKNALFIPSRTSNVLTIQFRSPSPAFAAAAANAYAKAFLETNVELKTDATKDTAGWFGDRSNQERARLEEAEARLSSFQREHGIVATDERLDVETQRLAELNTQLTVIQGVRGESASRGEAAHGHMGTSPDVLHSSVVEALRTEIARSTAKLDELGRQYGHNHPQYQSAATELASLKERLQNEMQQVASSVGATNDVNVRRENEILAAVRAQKTRVLDLRAQRDQVAVLQRDVESAQKAYDLVAQRLSQTKLESQVQNTNIEVLTEARPPRLPSSPKPVLYTVIATAFGLLLGCALAIGVDLRRRPLRSTSDVADLLALPVLASLPHLRIGRVHKA